MRPASILIIGAGIGGLTAAIHLARAGVHVMVLEKNSRPGGRCGRLVRQGHHFDTVPTLFVFPKMYEAEFRRLGTSLSEQLDLLRVDPTYTLVFDDGSRLDLTSDLLAMQSQLEAIEPGSFSSLLRYLDEGALHYKLVTERLVDRNFHHLTSVLGLLDPKLASGLHPLQRHYGHMSAFFKEPRLKSAFTFQDIYTGLNPFSAPATFSMMPYTELAHGVYYPRGGMYRIVESLYALAVQSGVEFGFDTSVERIEVDQARARSVVLAGGGRMTADAVLANADLPYVYSTLLPPDRIERSIRRKELSCSAVSFFWGLDQAYPSLAPHTLFLADDFRQNFETIEKDHGLPENPSLYLHAPARLDASMAPPGQDTLIAIIPVGHLSESSPQDWDVLRDRARAQVLRRLKTMGIEGLESHIKFEESCTPLSWKQRYNLAKGATHGLSHRLSQMACFRPANRHPVYRNLYFVGASTHPGTGIPTSMVSGRLVSGRILEEMGRN